MKNNPKDWNPEFPELYNTRIEQCLVVLAPNWFARADFQRWRRRSGVATWKEPAVDGQDVFIVYADHEMDWHTKDLPDDILKKLEIIVEATKMDYGTIWIKAV